MKSTRRMLFGLLASLMLGSAHAHEDAVLEWNQIAFDVLLNQPPPIQMRFGAIVQLAVFEAVNAVSGEYESTVGFPSASRDASAEAAAVSAAHRVLRTYLPDHVVEFDAARDRSLARIPQGPGRDAGIAVGEAAAAAVMASRENDGSDFPESFLPDSANPGDWQLTRGCPPEGGVFLHWRKVKPFVIRHVEHFRSAPPPPLNSWRYARAYAEVKAVGARDSKQRPADRAVVAQFYNHFGDAGLWNPIGRQLAKARRQTLAENAHTFALLNLALHDLTIALVETKYHYHFWRPETAIPAGDTDGNEQTEPDASYVPLIETPCHPSYGSGHAATSGTAREVLERAFGPRGHRIVLRSPDAPGVVLEYSTLEEITEDIDDARVFGGIHFRFDQAAGAEQGRRVGSHVWRHAFKQANSCRDR
jgi:PAP2 superfamily